MLTVPLEAGGPRHASCSTCSGGPGRAEVDEARLGLDVSLPGRVVVEVVAADVGEGDRVEVAGADPLLDQRVRGHLAQNITGQNAHGSKSLFIESSRTLRPP